MSTTYFQVQARNDLPWYKYRTTISGTIYTLHFRFNTRSSRWYLDVCDATDSPILMGIPLLINQNLAGQYTTLSLPNGTFFITDDSGQGTQPTLLSFGTTHTLWYAEDT